MNKIANRILVTSSQMASKLVRTRHFEAMAPHNKRMHATCESHARDARAAAKELWQWCCKAIVALSTALVLTCEAANRSDDPINQVRYRCDQNWGVEVYLQSFKNLRAPMSEDRSTLVDWRKTYVFEENDENPILRSSKPLRFDCVVEGTAFSIIFESYLEEARGVSVDGLGPRPTVTIVSAGRAILKKSVLGLCPIGGTRWPKCPDDWLVRVAVSRPGDPLVLIQRLTSEFVE